MWEKEKSVRDSKLLLRKNKELINRNMNAKYELWKKELPKKVKIS